MDRENNANYTTYNPFSTAVEKAWRVIQGSGLGSFNQKCLDLAANIIIEDLLDTYEEENICNGCGGPLH